MKPARNNDRVVQYEGVRDQMGKDGLKAIGFFFIVLPLCFAALMSFLMF